MQRTHKVAGIIILMLGFLGSAHAGGSATISSSEGDLVRMEYLGDKLSMSVSEGDERMILRDGKMFMISGDTVIDTSSMLGMLGQQIPNVGPEDVDQFKSLESTGRNETVAGVKGEVHVLKYVDADGQAHSKELVLSNDPRAVALSKALSNMASTMSKLTQVPTTDGNARFEAALKGRGLLRADQDFKVVRFDNAPAASRFELPSAPQSIPDLQGLMGGGATAEPQSAEGAGGGLLDGLFGQKAERQQERIEQRTDAEVDEATDSMVDKALDKAFGKLFGD